MDRIIILILALFMLSCSRNNLQENTTMGQGLDLSLIHENDWEMVLDFDESFKKFRDSLGLNRLRIDKSYACALAIAHTQYMIDVGQISHDRFGYRLELLKSRGAIRVGENVAYGYVNSNDALWAMVQSPDHFKILKGNYSKVGIGILKNQNNAYYYTFLFFKD